MRYTLQNGVKSSYSGRVTDGLRYVLPLLVLFVGLVLYLVAPKHTVKNNNPLTLGIYTVKTGNKSSKPDNKNNNQGSNNQTSQAAELAPQAGVANVAPINTASSLGYSTASLGTTTSPVGGMGGGGITTATTPPPPPSTGGSGGSTGSGTISCVNQLTGTATLCLFPYQTCTIPLAGITGYKTVDGTCITIN